MLCFFFLAQHTDLSSMGKQCHTSVLIKIKYMFNILIFITWDIGLDNWNNNDFCYVGFEEKV